MPFSVFWFHHKCPGLRPRKSIRDTKNSLFSFFVFFFIRLRVLSMWQTFKNCAKCYFRGLGIAKISNLENFHDFETGSELQHLPPEFWGVAKILPYRWGCVPLAGGLGLGLWVKRASLGVKKCVWLKESPPIMVRSACYSCGTKRFGHLSRVAVLASPVRDWPWRRPTSR